MQKRSSLERQMLTYFGFIAAAALLITVEFVWAVRVIVTETEHLMPMPDVAAGTGHVISVLGALQNKVILMGAVQAVVTLIILVMLIRRITGPLQHMVDQSRLISDGDLSRTVHIYRNDEIGLLAETINGLTANIHEIVAFGLSTDHAIRASLQQLRLGVGENADALKQLSLIETKITSLTNVLEGFQLLPELTNHGKAESQP
jgi:methyl-accepting chemotaxis protein